jgi:hypothetical protein
MAWYQANKDTPRGRFAADARRIMQPEQVERARAEFAAEMHEDSHNNAFELWLVWRIDALLLKLQQTALDFRTAIEHWAVEALEQAPELVPDPLPETQPEAVVVHKVVPEPELVPVSHVDVVPLEPETPAPANAADEQPDPYGVDVAEDPAVEVVPEAPVEH